MGEPHATRTPQHGPGPTVERLTVLVVDDDVFARRALVSLLSECSYVEVVASAADGAAAVDAVAALHPDVVVMDVRMPFLDGLEAAHVIKVADPTTRVVLMTMFPVSDYELFESHADAFLLKGSSLDEITRALRGDDEIGGPDSRGKRNAREHH